ncbi:MAG: hypothetical protein H0T89_28785 [Deltaproteobacteria bacterium]|nr:hypothetical protein [Deltaproteobacteria bacterium]MDQ3295863.1 hypothetical protein [Myxococcota bacterium]
MRERRAVLLAAGLAITLTGCTGQIGDVGTGSNEMVGAGGRNISEYWPSIDVPLSQNTRMLSFEMLRSEVSRATGRSWMIAGVDQWDRNRGPLGGADYVTTFGDDLTPSQQRIVLIRKMAFQVCGDLIAAEAGAATRTVFTVVDPGAPIDVAASTTTTQITALFQRFFLTDAVDTDVADAKALLGTLAGADGKTAWRGLCAAYLGSMRFLTY